jgi:hypothetical protein
MPWRLGDDGTRGPFYAKQIALLENFADSKTRVCSKPRSNARWRLRRPTAISQSEAKIRRSVEAKTCRAEDDCRH